jgi:hypothetical protein
MLTVQQIEEACDRSQPLQFDRYPNDVPEAALVQTFYPLGFPVRIRTNSEEVLRQSEIKWGMFEKRFSVDPIVADIIVVETEETECPPLPQYRFFDNMMVVTAGVANFCIASFPHGKTRMVVTTAALQHANYFRQVFLDCVAACQMGTRHITGIHAGCVALNHRGVMLCGDSGAGKTSLSWACARAGWDFLSDDTSYLLHGQENRAVMGNRHQVRFRPAAAQLFPEVAGAEITPRVYGQPSIELPTAPMTHIRSRDCVHVDFIVFLNRRIPGAAELVPYRQDVARCYMHQWLFGSPEIKSVHHAAIERLLTAPVLELRYQCLDWAVNRLEQLVREGTW